MFKNQYNSNPIVFSPDGQLLQLNFASKASERGNFSLSLKSKNHLILLSSSKSKQINNSKENRIVTLGNNISMIATGISKDGKLLYEILKKKKLEIENSSNRIPQVPEIAIFCSKVISRNTYYSNMRPFGIKVIIIGFDSNGPSIFQVNVDGNYQRKSYSAQGKGANKVINGVENYSTELENFSTDELMICVFSIYFESLEENQKTSPHENSLSIALLGKNSELFILNENMIKFYLKIFKYKLEKTEERTFEYPRNYEDLETESSIEWSDYDSEP